MSDEVKSSEGQTTGMQAAEGQTPEVKSADTLFLEVVLSLSPELKVRDKADRPAVTVPPERLIETMEKLRADGRFQFDMLMAHTAVDRVSEQMIELLYELYSSSLPHKLLVSVVVPRKEPVVPTVSKIWAIAEWQEREVYDLFGVLYAGHPDLRRLLLEDDWKGHPLLKDYQDDFILERPW